MGKATTPFAFGRYLALKEASELRPDDKEIAAKTEEAKKSWLLLEELDKERGDDQGYIKPPIEPETTGFPEVILDPVTFTLLREELKSPELTDRATRKRYFLATTWMHGYPHKGFKIVKRIVNEGDN